jgi:hypothetical protein
MTILFSCYPLGIIAMKSQAVVKAFCSGILRFNQQSESRVAEFTGVSTGGFD